MFRKYSRKGFTLVEVLLTLGIMLIIVTSLTPLANVISHAHNLKGNDEDIYIGIKLTSQYLLGSYFIDMTNGYHYISNEQEEMHLVFEKGRLVKKDGYEILIHDIDGNFEIENQMLYANIQREDRNYRFLLGYVREKKEIEVK